MTLILRLQFWVGRGISDAGNKTGNLLVLDREDGKPVFGVGQIMIGTDYPFPLNKVPVDHVLSIPGLSDDDRIAILDGTAAKPLGLN